ncbi:iron-containing alcohol dehydrogenase family protein [Microbacterium sp. X-17]|uniref:iron-containing alcohol dehydrogenase family protein n=1 Tax=Microbacterium sp. X-17 TaxID=3144404 RepID=UPI0031F5D41F
MRHFSSPLRLHAGAGALDQLPAELTRLRVERVLIVCSGSLARRDPGILARVRELLDPRHVVLFDGVQEHSPVEVVETVRDLIRAEEVQGVVVIGGGSAIVTARAATILAAESGSVAELATHRGADGRLVSPRLSAPKIPQWIVPSTPTTAYAKAGAGVHDVATGTRLALFDPKARATGVILDPTVAATAPGRVVRGAAMNALSMAIDGLQSGSDDPLAEAYLTHALRMLRDDLPAVPGGDELVDGALGVRLMIASLMIGEASDYVGTGLAQPLSHALGRRSSVGNGIVEALLVPHVMRFNAGVTDAGLRAVAAALRPEREPDPAEAVDAVEELLARAGAPRRLREVGVDRDALEDVAAHAEDDWSITRVPRPATSDELRGLLAEAW